MGERRKLGVGSWWALEFGLTELNIALPRPCDMDFTYDPDGWVVTR